MIDWGKLDGLGSHVRTVYESPMTYVIHFEPMYLIDGFRLLQKEYIGYLMSKYKGTEHEAEVLAFVLGIKT